MYMGNYYLENTIYIRNKYTRGQCEDLFYTTNRNVKCAKEQLGDNFNNIIILNS